MKSLSWTNVALGLWLVIAPFALLYAGVSLALWDNVIVGILIAAISLCCALASESKWVRASSWFIAALGLWTLITPFVLHYREVPMAMWNNVIVGVLVAGVAIFTAMSKPSGRLPGHPHDAR